MAQPQVTWNAIFLHASNAITPATPRGFSAAFVAGGWTYEVQTNITPGWQAIEAKSIALGSTVPPECIVWTPWGKASNGDLKFGQWRECQAEVPRAASEGDFVEAFAAHYATTGNVPWFYLGSLDYLGDMDDMNAARAGQFISDSVTPIRLLAKVTGVKPKIIIDASGVNDANSASWLAASLLRQDHYTRDGVVQDGFLVGCEPCPFAAQWRGQSSEIAFNTRATMNSGVAGGVYPGTPPTTTVPMAALYSAGDAAFFAEYAVWFIDYGAQIGVPAYPGQVAASQAFMEAVVDEIIASG